MVMEARFGQPDACFQHQALINLDSRVDLEPTCKQQSSMFRIYFTFSFSSRPTCLLLAFPKLILV